MPLWNETAAAGTTNFGNRLPCVASYETSCDLVPPASGRYFAKYIDQSPEHANVKGTMSPPRYYRQGRRIGHFEKVELNKYVGPPYCGTEMYAGRVWAIDIIIILTLHQS